MIRVLKAGTEALREQAFAIRREVFVVEQCVSPEEEFDEFEDTSTHFVAMGEGGEPVGAARWRRTEKGIKLERFAVKASHRGKGTGSALVEAVLADIGEQAGPGNHLYLHAQLPAVPLYEKHGFQKKGEQFLECEILHYLMWKTS